MGRPLLSRLPARADPILLWGLIGAVVGLELWMARARLHHADFALYGGLQLAATLLLTGAAFWAVRRRGGRAGDPLAEREGEGPRRPADLIEWLAGAGPLRGPLRVRVLGTSVGCLFLALYHLYHGFAGQSEPISFLVTHLGVVLFLAFLLAPADGREWRRCAPWTGLVDFPLALLALGAALYVLWDVEAFIFRRGAFDPVDMVVGTLVIALVLEATRRMVGWAMVVLAVALLIYTNQAHHFPGVLMAAPASWPSLIDTQFMETLGIFSVPLQVAASYIMLFLLFGALLMRTGAGALFMDLAYALTGRYAGGPAKASVIASSLFGSISGSAVANVSSTGSFTIPLMKRTGFPARFAGATEAVASTGGQLMPPVMGAAAFVVAEFVGVSYLEVAAAGLVPSLLYYLALFLFVHVEARRVGLAGMNEAELPTLLGALGRGWHLLAPLAVIVGLLLAGYTATLAGFWGCLSVVAAGMLRRLSRLEPTALIGVLQEGLRAGVAVSVACAAAGLIIGSMFASGLGIRLSAMIIDFAAGQVWLVLLLTMLCSIILGMGMTTTAVYISVATLIAPALVDLGVEPMAAHLFVLYFGVISCVTPPVAIASFAGAGIAGAPPMATALVGMRLAAAGFIVPFAFVYGPGLLLIGPPTVIAFNILSAVLGVSTLVLAIHGWFRAPLNVAERLLLGAAALAMISANMAFDVAGVAVAMSILGRRWLVSGQRKGTVATDPPDMAT